MSWSTRFEIPKNSGIADNGIHEFVDRAINLKITGNENCLEEREAAIDAALDAVEDVLVSGALGDMEEHEWQIGLSGHCNPMNSPVEGYANDCINISIVQK